MKKRILLALAALLAGFQLMTAIPARPGRFTVTQPDGSRITLQMHGDEWGHWLTNASGQMVRADEDGFYRIVSADEAAVIRQQVVENRTLRFQARVQARARRAARANAAPIALGQKRFLVILVEFTNKQFSTSEDPHAAFTDLLNKPGYSVNGATGSARDFYYENSHGVFEPIFDVYGPVQLDTTYAYYGQNDNQGNDKRAEQAIIDGCTKLDGEIDFTRYDNDGDGTVDLVFMYYAGMGEADGGGSNTIWPHQWEISSAGKSLTLDGMKIDSYACTNEVVDYGGGERMCGIGTACHEFGHAMGLPDFYDADYGTNGQAGGLYSFSTMDNGSYNNDGRTPPYFNIEERVLLGWLDWDEVVREFPKSGTYTIPSVDENVAYMTHTDKDGEYFIYECRGSNGWDAYLPAQGMLVYHVDKSDRKVFDWATARSLWDNWRESNSINAKGSHPCFYVVPAASQSSLNYYYEDKMPFPGADNVTTYIPKSWNGVESDITFSGISYADNRVTLKVTVPAEDVDFVTIADAGSYHAGDRFTFGLVLPEHVEAPASVAWYYDDEPAGADSVTLTAGAHVIDARLTYADGRQGTLTLEITVN